MRKNWWVKFTLLLIVPVFMLITSCAQQTKTVPEEEPTATETAEETAETEAVVTPEEETPVESEPIDDGSSAKKDLNNFIHMDARFAFDSAALDETSQKILRMKAEYLRNNPDVAVYVEGHCDERGTTEYNLGLGEKRAVAARNFLIDMGIASYRLEAVSYGEERPADPNSNEIAWKKNRRAHFTIK